MVTKQPPAEDFVRVAEVEVEAVRPVSTGFELLGRGSDHAEYRLDLHLEMPVDRRTRAVVGELLAQSECRIWRRAAQPLGAKPPRASRKPVS